MRYKCINAFSVPRYDECEEEIEGKSLYVRKGSLWETDEYFKVGLGDITLIKVKGLDWLGISKEMLDKNFVEVEDE